MFVYVSDVYQLQVFKNVSIEICWNKVNMWKMDVHSTDRGKDNRHVDQTKSGSSVASSEDVSEDISEKYLD